MVALKKKTLGATETVPVVNAKKLKVVEGGKGKKKRAVKGDPIDDVVAALAKDFDVEVMSETAEDKTPYYIPFRHVGLQYITGGVPGGRMTVIEGDSQCGKSYLVYELISECLNQDGYAFLVDPEIAYEPRYGKRVGITGQKRFLYSQERQMEKIFPMIRKFVLAIRKRDRKSPIFVGIDSYPAMQIKMAVDEISKENFKELKGYMAARKNAVFAELISEFIGFVAKHRVTFVLVNQLRTKMNVMFGDSTTTNAETIIKYYATLRIRGRLGAKIKDKTAKSKDDDDAKAKQIGVNSTWETIKNRNVDPFKKVETKILYRSGVHPFSGLRDLLVAEGKIIGLPKKQFQYKGKTHDGDSIKSFIEKRPELLTHTA